MAAPSARAIIRDDPQRAACRAISQPAVGHANEQRIQGMRTRLIVCHPEYPRCCRSLTSRASCDFAELCCTAQSSSSSGPAQFDARPVPHVSDPAPLRGVRRCRLSARLAELVCAASTQKDAPGARTRGTPGAERGAQAQAPAAAAARAEAGDRAAAERPTSAENRNSTVSTLSARRWHPLILYRSADLSEDKFRRPHGAARLASVCPHRLYGCAFTSAAEPTCSPPRQSS